MPAPKPYIVLATENKSHRTKEELRDRKAAEEALLTGEKLKERPETKKNKAAHKEFLRLRKLLNSIDKDDDIFGSAINRYCMLQAETLEFEDKSETMYQGIKDFQETKDEIVEERSLTYFYSTLAKLEKTLIDMDKQLMQKRKMLLDLEKENLMTVAAALRSIPKKSTEKKSKLREVVK